MANDNKEREQHSGVEESIPEKAGDNQEIRNDKGQFVPGVSGNPAGKPRGTESFRTKFIRVIEKIGKESNLTSDEVEAQLIIVGLKKAREGDYNFYRDIFDRNYGRPVQTTELTGKDGEPLMPQESSDRIKELAKILKETDGI